MTGIMFQGSPQLSIGIMVYSLSPFTNPNPKLIKENVLHFYIFKKESLFFYKLFSSWGPKHLPTSKRILDITIFVGTFVPIM